MKELPTSSAFIRGADGRSRRVGQCSSTKSSGEAVGYDCRTPTEDIRNCRQRHHARRLEKRAHLGKWR